ncbi:type II toxin-antitoxin system RelE/ParE family toxin [Rhodopirellula sp. P2]|uniref:type II toxin-antitoxin system RelE/ParE family toxin n=1 Tax=Rhodopirellula sp. P2 TaxID=2127060 RepID=UPI0023680E6B|nr:type II toxin-antitoxin system RelE/ParE family toxin [Rhodopirellula sp. P2]WDQ14949.1 type II toxin-antitoxin system RelE/ParE family toxin [Rhodopirellula sp. P2]
MSVRLVDEVFLDLRAARDWYDRKSFGLGDEFADLFFTIARGLPDVSLHHAIDETGYRPIRMPRFTAVIYYDLTDIEIVVVGVLVNGRNASALKNRG